MQFPFSFFDVLVIPSGATSGTRIVIDGVNGTITGYDASDNVTFQLAGDVTVFGPLTGSRVEISDGDFFIYDDSNTLVATVNESGFTTINPSSGESATLSPSAGASAAPVSAESETGAPGTTHPTPSVTLTGTDNIEVRFVAVVPGVAAVGTSFTSPAGFTERTDLSGPADRCHSTTATRAAQPAGAAGVQNFTSSFNFNSAQDWESGISVGLVSSTTPASFRSVASSTMTGFGTDTVARPAGTVNDDLLLMQLVGGGVGTGSNPVVMAPVGWTLLETDGSPTDADGTHSVYYRVANAEPANYTVTYSEASGGSPTCDFTAVVIALQNVDVTATALPGLVLEGDTNLYRSGVSQLATDDSLTVGRDLTVLDDLVVGDDVTISGDAAVTGNVTAANVTATATVAAADVTVSDDLTVTDDIILQSGGDLILQGSTDATLDNQSGRLHLNGFTVPMGKIAQFTATSNDGPHSADTASDMVLNNVPVVINRLYGIHLHTQVTLSVPTTAGLTVSWNILLQLNGSTIDRFAAVRNFSDTIGTAVTWVQTVDAWCYWTAPATQATDDFVVFLDEVAGDGTIQLDGAAVAARTLTIVDFGA